MIWTKILGYWKAGLALLLSLGASALTFFAMQSKSRKKENKRLEKEVKHAKKVLEADKEADREFDKRTEDLATEIEEKKTSSELANPNEW